MTRKFKKVSVAFVLSAAVSLVKLHMVVNSPPGAVRIASDADIFIPAAVPSAACGTVAGLRHTDHQIGLNRRIHGKELSCENPGIVYAHIVNVAVRSCEINILKNTSGMLLFGKAHALIRLDSLFR